MRLAITGSSGFLGWHTTCRLRALHGVEAVPIDRNHLGDPRRLVAALTGVDAVLHVAGVNRAESAEGVEQGNICLAEALASAVQAVGHPLEVVFANSVQADLDNPYGRGKRAAAEILGSSVRSTGGKFADLLFPNLFGEHGRPDYNSFVATFAHVIAKGGAPTVTDDREIPLLHAQEAAQQLIASVGRDERRVVPGEPIGISAILASLQRIHELYACRGEIPPLKDRFDVNLFNTYRAATFPWMWPITPDVFSDGRGDLFETLRSHGSTGQAFVSTTKPGEARGEHYHLHKIERFFVLRGTAEIRVRRLMHGDVTTFTLSGERPSFVDMPTLWAHNIRNVGDDELITMFWADQLLDRENPDQFPEVVDS